MTRLTVLAAVSSLAFAHAPLAAQDVRIALDGDAAGPQIDRHIFGQFAEHLGTGIYGGVWVGEDSEIPNVRGIRTDVVQALKTLKIPNVRYPGGCFADEYHWRDGVGPNRRSTVNANWGNAIDPNTFGTDEFFDFIGMIDSEAYISVNVGSGTIQEAADWMAYMTADTRSSAGQDRAANGHAEPYEIAFLGLGNENWGCGGHMTPEHYVDLMKRHARFDRNYNPAQPADGDNAMKRVAVGPSGDDPSYTEAVMKAWAGRDWTWSIEGLSLHYYSVPEWPASRPSVDFDEDDYALILQTTLKMDDLLKQHSAIMDKYDPEKTVPLIVDEWGVWLAENPGSPAGFLQQQNSLRDAIVAALNFNIFARHADRVRGANIAQMVNVLQAMILTDGARMLLTPTYHVHEMYLPMQDATLVPIEFDGGWYHRNGMALPGVDALAFRDTAGKLWLSLVNLDPSEEKDIVLELSDIRVSRAEGQVLTGPNVNSINSFEAPDTISPRAIRGAVNGARVRVNLPAKSIAVLALED